MTSNHYKIEGIIDQIKATDDMAKMWEEADDEVHKFMAWQHRRRKKEFLKELLAELALSGMNFKDTGSLIQDLTAYLEKADEAPAASKEFKLHIAEVQKLMAAA